MRAIQLFTLAAVVMSGCVTDIGECDEAAAKRVVFRIGTSDADPEEGVPMYEGQAIVAGSCGSNQFCHARLATGDARHGVPRGLDFDFGVVCHDEKCGYFEPTPGNPNEDREYEALAALEGSQRRALDWARFLLADVRRGSMPPGRAGSLVAGPDFSYPDFTAAHDGIRASGLRVACDVDPSTPAPDCDGSVPCDNDANTPTEDCVYGATGSGVSCGYQYAAFNFVPWPRVPRAGSHAANEILRNWLACGAPVIESTISSSAGTEGRLCNFPDDRDHVGDCAVRIPPHITPPQPNWDSIFGLVVRPLCGSTCHDPSNAAFDSSKLDLHGGPTAMNISEAATEVLARLVNGPVEGSECAAAGEHPLLSFDPEDPGAVHLPADYSLFFRKLTGSADPVTGEFCGSTMPPGSAMLPEDVLAPIRQWIEAGAQRFPTQTTPPDANWDSIFEEVVEPLCGATCHNPNNAAFASSLLDLSSDADDVYERLLVGANGMPALASGSECAGTMSRLLYADAARPAEDSLFFRKLTGTGDLCGCAMPRAQAPLSPALIDPIRQWIEAGAPR